LSLSVVSALRDQERVLEDFTAENRVQLHAAATSFASRLDALDRDTRMLSDLVDRSTSDRALEPDTERRVWESAFRALANVVAPYRSIALYHPDGTLDVGVLDPTEDPGTRALLLAQGSALVPILKEAASGTLSKSTVRVGERSFFI